MAGKTLRSRLKAVALTVGAVGGAGGLVWLGLTGFPLLTLVPVAVVAVLGAALFVERDAPSDRFERWLKQIRRR
jgi:hypothetical protein